jgi:hypothetical protein
MLGSETGLNGAGAAFAPAVETPKKINNHITQKIGQPKSKHHARKIGTKTAKKAIGRAASKAFPASSFQEALTIADAIQAYSGGSGKIRRLTLFDALKKSPDSGPSRQLVTNSARYGLTTGSYKAEHLELTSKGNLATNVEGDPKEKLKARFELAISSRRSRRYTTSLLATSCQRNPSCTTSCARRESRMLTSPSVPMRSS